MGNENDTNERKITTTGFVFERKSEYMKYDMSTSLVKMVKLIVAKHSSSIASIHRNEMFEWMHLFS